MLLNELNGAAKLYATRRSFLDETMAKSDAIYLPAIPFPVPRIDETDLEQRPGELLRVLVS
jgi:hypothetical protein